MSGRAYEVHLLKLTPLVATMSSVLGIAVAIAIFGKGGTAPLASILERWDQAAYVDRAWAWGYRSVLGGISGISGWFDRYVVDGLVNLSGYATIEAAQRIKVINSGKVRDYVVYLGAGALALVFWAVLR
jgi:NAD(P)H-quinone oxidoreductase subunit 5